MMNDAFSRARAWMDKEPPAISGQDGHGQTYHVAAVLAQGFELSEVDVLRVLIEYNQRCFPPWSEAELAHKAKQSQTASPGDKPRGYMLHKNATAPKRRTYTPLKIAKPVITPIPSSPLPDPLPDGTRALIRAVFREGEGIRIADARLNDDGREVPANEGPCWSREEWLKKLDAKGGDPNGIWRSSKRTGIYISINPMRLGGSKDSDVTAFRHALVEFDNVSRAEQWALYKASNLPCAAIISSGGKSIHAWVRVDAQNRAEYDERVRIIYEHFSGSGHELDTKNKNPSRFSRLPNCVRFDKRQELLALGIGASSFTEWLKERENEDLGECLSISDLLPLNTDSDPGCIIGFDGKRTLRYLCKGKAAWLIGPSGVGKSSLLAQFAIGWAQGKPVFGIAPKGELKSLIIQAENDDMDLAEMVRGIAAAHGLTEEWDGKLLRDMVIFKTETTSIGEAFVERLHRLIDRDKPQIVWIDPLLSFAGIDVSKQTDVSHFLRQLLQPVLNSTGVCLIGLHHTGKPRDARQTQSWTAVDWAYNGIGSSELVNWARAVMVLHPHGPNEYELKLAKRGPRAGATHPDGTRAFDSIWIRHSNKGIMWEQTPPPAPPEVIESTKPAKAPKITAAESLLQVLTTGPSPTPWQTLAAEMPKAGESKNALGKRISKRATTLKHDLGEQACRKTIVSELLKKDLLRYDEKNELYQPSVPTTNT